MAIFCVTNHFAEHLPNWVLTSSQKPGIIDARNIYKVGTCIGLSGRFGEELSRY